MNKLIVLVLAFMVVFTGCLATSEIKSQETPDFNKSRGIFDNAERLYEEYRWKLDLVTEIQQRADALGNEATREIYIEWQRRNNEAIDAGERLATYITENRYVLDQFWTSDVLVLIAKNKVTFERDNQALEQRIKSLEQSAYSWQIDYYGREGSRDLGTLTFINRGRSLSDVKFRFEFYMSSGSLYSEESVPIGNIGSGKIVQKKISLPGRYLGIETWSHEKVFVSINGSVRESWIYENGEWKKQ